MVKKSEFTQVQFDALNNENSQLQEQVKQLTTQKKILEAEKASHQATINDLLQKNHNLNTNFVLLNNDHQTAAKGEKDMAAKFLTAEAELKALKEAHSKLEKKINKFEKKTAKESPEETEEDFYETEPVNQAA